MSKVRYVQDKLQFFPISKTKKETQANMEFLQKSRRKYFRYFKEQAIANRVFRTVEQHFQYFWTTCIYHLSDYHALFTHSKEARLSLLSFEYNLSPNLISK